MNSKTEHIHPIFDQILKREAKEKLHKQRAKVIWMTGLSGSGKSTIAKDFEKHLYDMGYATKLLDGDNVRTGINNNLGFSHEDRVENIRRIAEVSKLFVNAGIVTIACFVSPTNDIRKVARDIIGEEDFLEVYVNAPFDVCEQRDVKGLYKKARAGIIKDFTGLDAPFDEPANPAVEIKTDEMDIHESVQKLLDAVIPHIKYQGE